MKVFSTRPRRFKLPFLLFALVLPLCSRADTTIGTGISSLPYNVAKPGVYHLTKNLTYTPATGSAININVPNVIIDLNGYVLAGSTGSATASFGIHSPGGYNNIIIKDGIVEGFQYGVFLPSNNHATVSDMQVENNYSGGIVVTGSFAQIDRNRVAKIGGGVGATHAVGIAFTGTYANIANNDVQLVTGPDHSGDYSNGIRLDGCSNVTLTNNRVFDVEPLAPASETSVGIETISCDALVFLTNTVLTTDVAFDLSGASSGEYGDNITVNSTTPYSTSGTGMTSIGNNN